MALLDNIFKAAGKVLEVTAVEGVKGFNSAKENLNPQELIKRAQKKVYLDQMKQKYLREKGLKRTSSSAINEATEEFEKFKAEMEAEIKLMGDINDNN